jgi:uncharacterized protein YabE (DUF348 family)
VPLFLAAIRCGRRGWALISLLLVAGLLVSYGLIDAVIQKSITLDVGGEARQFRTQADTVGAALDDAGILIDPEDVIIPDLSTALHDGDVITVHKAHVVAVEADGSVRRVRTQAVHPLDVLVGQQISLAKHDRVRVDGQTYSPMALESGTWSDPVRSISVVRSVTITVIDSGIAGDHVRTIHTTQADVGRALDEAGIALYLADRVTPGLSAPIEDGLVVLIYRSLSVTVIVDGRTLDTRAAGPTVGDALAAVGIAPFGLDVTIPPETALLEPHMTIQVVRVTEDLIIETVPIPTSTIYQPQPDLARGEWIEIQAGAAGELERHIRVRYADGVETERQIVSERVIRQPVPRVVGYGKVEYE